jgi:hypothetical protein
LRNTNWGWGIGRINVSDSRLGSIHWGANLNGILCCPERFTFINTFSTLRLQKGITWSA